jgi:hypothetical protein
VDNGLFSRLYVPTVAGKYGAVNDGFIKRYYSLLDQIHPNRVKSAEQWLRQDNEAGIKDSWGS